MDMLELRENFLREHAPEALEAERALRKRCRRHQKTVLKQLGGYAHKESLQDVLDRLEEKREQAGIDLELYTVISHHVDKMTLETILDDAIAVAEGTGVRAEKARLFPDLHRVPRRSKGHGGNLFADLYEEGE